MCTAISFLSLYCPLTSLKCTVPFCERNTQFCSAICSGHMKAKVTLCHPFSLHAICKKRFYKSLWMQNPHYAINDFSLASFPWGHFSCLVHSCCVQSLFPRFQEFISWLFLKKKCHSHFSQLDILFFWEKFGDWDYARRKKFMTPYIR